MREDTGTDPLVGWRRHRGPRYRSEEFGVVVFPDGVIVRARSVKGIIEMRPKRAELRWRRATGKWRGRRWRWWWRVGSA